MKDYLISELDEGGVSQHEWALYHRAAQQNLADEGTTVLEHW